MLLAEVLLIIAILFLAGKDASSYLLKDKDNNGDELTLKRIQRWHRDGIVLYLLYLSKSLANISLCSFY